MTSARAIVFAALATCVLSPAEAATPIALTKQADLVFGSLVGTTSGSIVATVPTGSDTLIVAVTHRAPAGAGDFPKRARFLVTGEPNAPFRTSITTMGTAGVVYDVDAPVSLSGSGMAIIHVGATWTVGTSDSGTLATTFDLTVEYDPALFP